MSEQTIYPEVLARVALRDTPSMVATLHAIHRSIVNHDEAQVGRVLAEFSGELVAAFREAEALIAELQGDRAELVALLVAAQDAAPLKRRSSRKGK